MGLVKTYLELDKVRGYFEPRAVLDIGANIGLFYRECKQAFPHSEVFCIEANRNCEESLQGLTNNYRICLLGGEDKTVGFYRDKTDKFSAGNSIYRELTEFFRDANVEVTTEEMVRLDSINFAVSFDLIKLDTQGSELDIIRGGLSVCKKAKGLILEVSTLPYNDGAPLQVEVISYMSSVGCDPVAVLGENTAGQRDLLFLNSVVFPWVVKSHLGLALPAVTKPRLSLCMIVRDVDDILDRCLASIEDHVDQIVIVDTGSVDNTKEVARKHAKVVVFDYTPSSHPESFFKDIPAEVGNIVPGPYSRLWCLGDFAAARQYGFDRATGDYIMWLDSDDVVEGAENIPALLDDMVKKNLDGIHLIYDYDHDEDGSTKCVLIRERIVKKNLTTWSGMVHEFLTLEPPHELDNRVKVVHRRGAPKATVHIPNRNLKILIRQLRQERHNNTNNPRTLYYLGQEYKHVDHFAALKYLSEYINLSEWDAERAAAYCRMGLIYEEHEQLPDAYRAYGMATIEDPSSPEGWFGLARIDHARKQWQRCIEHTEKGLALGDPPPVLQVNPYLRLYHPHLVYNEALAQVGRYVDAIKSCEAAQALRPGNSDLVDKIAAYRARLPIRIDLPADGLGDPPQPIPADILAKCALQIWKRLPTERRTAFLDALPGDIAATNAIKEARRGILTPPTVNYRMVTK